MRVNIYYGGRGLIDDPTLYVINKVQEVLEELRVNVQKYNLFELKTTITTLPQTLKEADGVILASTVEWFGIGGYMQQFLDACWLYGDKEKISKIYMQPIVMSTACGEREAMLSLQNAWQLLGGRDCSGICGYIDDLASFEVDESYNDYIEKSAENLYRYISQQIKTLPTSNMAVKENVFRTNRIELTPQENEQLSKYASDDKYVKQQKADIEELTNLFKTKLDQKDTSLSNEYIADFTNHYRRKNDVNTLYVLKIEGKNKDLILDVNNVEFNCYYGEVDTCDVEIKLGKDVIENIINGRMTFQRAFMSGEMVAKGDFSQLRVLDEIFSFV